MRTRTRGVLLALAGLLLAASCAPDGGPGAPTNGRHALFAHGDAVGAGVTDPPYPFGRLVAVAANPDGAGYWTLGADATVYAHGGAPDWGSAPAAFGWTPAVALVPNPHGPGYWVVAANGQMLTFGSAAPIAGPEVGAPITSAAANPHGPGLWLLAADGAVYPLGGAPSFGQMAGALGWVATVAIVPNPSGPGYWIVSAAGTVHTFGGAPDVGQAIGRRVVGAAASASGRGLWVLAAWGEVVTLGDAAFHGAPGAAYGLIPAAAIAATPTGGGYWVLFSPPLPPPRPRDNGPRPPAGSGEGRRIVYANGAQRIWIMNEDDSVRATYLVSGRAGVPSPGTYHVYYKGTGWAGNLRLDYFVGFAYGSGGGEIGFHRIPVRPDGSEIQPRSLLGTYQSHGCVRMALEDVIVLYDWVDYGDRVVVVP